MSTEWNKEWYRDFRAFTVRKFFDFLRKNRAVANFLEVFSM
jgi:hypothetical protein